MANRAADKIMGSSYKAARYSTSGLVKWFILHFTEAEWETSPIDIVEKVSKSKNEAFTNHSLIYYMANLNKSNKG